MKDDRSVICEIISQLLDNPDEYGIYKTTLAYDRLEAYCNEIRADAVAADRKLCWCRKQDGGMYEQT